MSDHCRCYSREHSSCHICSPERKKMLSNEKRIIEKKKKEERMFNVKIMLKSMDLLSESKTRLSLARSDKMSVLGNDIVMGDAVGGNSHLFKVSLDTKVSHLLVDIQTKYPERLKNHKLVLRVKKRRYGIEPLKSSHSKWKLDKYYDSCHKCRSKFSMIKRKHHCRSCGLIFCNDCCSNNHRYFNGENGITCGYCLKLLDNYPILCESKDMKFYNIKEGDEIFVLSDIRASMKKKSKKKNKSIKIKKTRKSKKNKYKR